jgi:hypothetical protein
MRPLIYSVGLYCLHSFHLHAVHINGAYSLLSNKALNTHIQNHSDSTQSETSVTT